MDAGGLSQACLKCKSAVRDHHPLAQEEAEVFSYDDLEFRYEPFPIGVAKPALAEDLYRELVDSYPSCSSALLGPSIPVRNQR
jgi:hypothetical protein